MTEDDVYLVLNQVFRELFADDSIVLTQVTSAENIDGWDSFNHLNIIAAVEHRFGIRLLSREIDGLSNVGDITRLVLTKIGTSPA